MRGFREIHEIKEEKVINKLNENYKRIKSEKEFSDNDANMLLVRGVYESSRWMLKTPPLVFSNQKHMRL